MPKLATYDLTNAGFEVLVLTQGAAIARAIRKKESHLMFKDLLSLFCVNLILDM